LKRDSVPLSEATFGVEQFASVEHTESSETGTAIEALANTDAAAHASPTAGKGPARFVRRAFGVGAAELRASRAGALADWPLGAAPSSRSTVPTAETAHASTGAVLGAGARDGDRPARAGARVCARTAAVVAPALPCHRDATHLRSGTGCRRTGNRPASRRPPAAGGASARGAAAAAASTAFGALAAAAASRAIAACEPAVRAIFGAFFGSAAVDRVSAVAIPCPVGRADASPSRAERHQENRAHAVSIHEAAFLECRDLPVPARGPLFHDVMRMRRTAASGRRAAGLRTMPVDGMRLGSLHAGLLLLAVALSGGCAFEPVSLGDNLDAGVAALAAPEDVTTESNALATGEPDALSATDEPDAALATDEADAPPALCLRNPSFYGGLTGIRGIGPRTMGKLPDWQVCDGIVDVNPGFCTMLPPAGTTMYLGLAEGYAAFQYPMSPSVSTELPAALPPGNYPFSIDLGVAVTTLAQGGFGSAGGAPVELVVYGSSTPCGRDQVLARTATITNKDTWVTYSTMLTANQPFSNLVLVPTLTASEGPDQAGAYVVVGNIATSSSCP
jgi:hypothetical protein